jgi:hypothetical protein
VRYVRQTRTHFKPVARGFIQPCLEQPEGPRYVVLKRVLVSAGQHAENSRCPLSPEKRAGEPCSDDVLSRDARLPSSASDAAFVGCDHGYCMAVDAELDGWQRASTIGRNIRAKYQ